MRIVAFCLASVAITLASGWHSQLVGQEPQAEGQPDYRKQLTDSRPLVRLQAALALAQQLDEPAIGVLIDLLAELPIAERRQAEQALQQLAGDWSPSPPLPGDDELSRKIRREAWAGWWRTVDGPALLTAFRQQSVSMEIGRNEGRNKLPLSAPRLLAVRKPPGATEALLGYLPINKDRSMREEIVKSLKSLVLVEGKPSQALVEALSDPLPVCRIAAADALAGPAGATYWPAIRKLLTDPDQEVRMRVALALANAQDKEAVPALIGLLAAMPRSQAWEAEDLLHRLAGPKSPSLPWGVDTAAARKKLHAAWQDWWQANAAAVNMADLEKTPEGWGVTVVAEIAPNAGNGPNAARIVFGGPAGFGGRVVGLERNGQPRWQIEKLDGPIDVQLLSGNRVLIAEYSGNRVTERDFSGKILWQVNNLPGQPVNVQRLANGNTFIALFDGNLNGGRMLMEVDLAGKTVATFGVGANPALQGGIGFGGGGGINLSEILLAARKGADGQMVCLMYDGTCVQLDATGKETRRFAVPQARISSVPISMGNIDITSKGHIIIAQNDNTVNEYDPDGKVVWQAKASGHHATRLANGNTLLATQTGGIVELDSAGRTVWQYDPPAGMQAVRARAR